jgi:Helix-turn-helix domain
MADDAVYLTPAQVAAWLQLTPVRVQRLRRQGQLRGIKCQGTWWFAQTEVSRLLFRMRQHPTPRERRPHEPDGL